MNVTTSSIKKCDLRKETSQELNGEEKYYRLRGIRTNIIIDNSVERCATQENGATCPPFFDKNYIVRRIALFTARFSFLRVRWSLRLRPVASKGANRPSLSTISIPSKSSIGGSRYRHLQNPTFYPIIESARENYNSDSMGSMIE